MIESTKKAIHKIEPGLKKYKTIMDNFYEVDVSQDIEFQRKFNGFYRIRQRPKDFYQTYYSLLEECKTKPLEFNEILITLNEKLGRIEASFSSKLLATINTSMPIWDVFVLENLKLKKPAQYSKTRIEDTVKLYNRIFCWYKNMTISSEGIQMLEIFENEYPESGISDIKKIDFILWQIRN
ncbi:MAG: hypothetical protein ISR90_02720 [Candidatus Marinimicrobia bacterium]|nr:hypothetical protein [Candidatus Neomarinimicrobiota bacterium]MBL7022953.1 hypothetical protein [Candidatus Neomarinimicrobiota bacterium]MBL7108771.1 hypothetical protein [Candidatus Neomarinimicrobiota bacterium]